MIDRIPSCLALFRRIATGWELHLVLAISFVASVCHTYRAARVDLFYP